ECAVEKLVGDNGRNCKILWRMRLEVREKGRIATKHRNDCIGIEQVLHLKKSREGRFCSSSVSSAARIKSSSIGPIRLSSHSQSSGRGSSMIDLPSFRMRTSFVSKRNSFGSRTACDRPDQNTLAV